MSVGDVGGYWSIGAKNNYQGRHLGFQTAISPTDTSVRSWGYTAWPVKE